MPQHIHFIAIGGSIMHSLALALQQQGIQVTGSDDEIYEPAYSKLQAAGLLPAETGWFPDKIYSGLDCIVVGMHARPDNPELKKALELGIPLYSYPEYVYQQSLHKHRVVIAGSHGKTTITAILIHVLRFAGRRFDYLIGAEVEGFPSMVQLDSHSPLIILEGDEYFTSPLHPYPKFLAYHHHIGLISGIAWDHINFYPYFEEYIRAFENFAENTPKAGILVFAGHDDLVGVIGRKERPDVTTIEYDVHPHEIREGVTYLIHEDTRIPLQIFGEHNMRNLSGAKAILMRLGISEKTFYQAIPHFKGATKRLELVGQNQQAAIFRDFAHAPSKLEASIRALKNQFPKRSLVACLELHTFSNLNKQYLSQYQNRFNLPEKAVVFYNPKEALHKNMELLSDEEIRKGFNNPNLEIFTSTEALRQYLFSQSWNNTNLVMMSTGNFNNFDFSELSRAILSPH
jgi:UDP-N-acetylmuramate: L-alanyl-gamma-D-glutamyl-meso-diaminopimelate ligase